jgi:PAS domain S-box-containing protein
MADAAVPVSEGVGRVSAVASNAAGRTSAARGRRPLIEGGPDAVATEPGSGTLELVLAEVERTWTRDLVVLAAVTACSVLVLFLVWEGVERVVATSDVERHRLHYLRGVSTTLLTTAIVVAVATQQHHARAESLRKEALRRGREAREAGTLLRLVVDATPAALIVLDEGLRVVQANKAAESVHGERLLGRTCREALASCHRLCDECPAERCFSTGSASGPYRAHTDPRTGEVLSVDCHPFDLPDGRRHVLLVERIVTEQKKLEARLVHQEKMAAFGLLAAGIAHDLGNPLSSIEAQMQILDEEALPRETAAVLGTVRQEVARLRRILRELVDFARRRRDETTYVSVQSVVEDTLRLLRHDRRMRGVQLATEFDPETPPVLIVEDHLTQVVTNLVLNSLDAMPSGGTLRLEVRPAGSRVALRLHDTGHGMDRAVLARCFEPLFTTKDAGKGTGLGLSICRDILAAAGGEIEMHSAPGKGATAVVSLPVAAGAGAIS